VEIGPTHLNSAGCRVLVGHGHRPNGQRPGQAHSITRPRQTLCHRATHRHLLRRPVPDRGAAPTCTCCPYPPPPMGYHRSQAPFLLLAPRLAPPLPPHMHRCCVDEPGVAPAQAPTLMSPCTHATPLTRARRRAIIRHKERPQQPRHCRLLPPRHNRECQTPPVPIRSRRRLLELHPAPMHLCVPSSSGLDYPSNPLPMDNSTEEVPPRAADSGESPFSPPPQNQCTASPAFTSVYSPTSSRCWFTVSTATPPPSHHGSSSTPHSPIFFDWATSPSAGMPFLTGRLC
jgi:hypothetical protein